MQTKQKMNLFMCTHGGASTRTKSLLSTKAGMESTASPNSTATSSSSALVSFGTALLAAVGCGQEIQSIHRYTFFRSRCQSLALRTMFVPNISCDCGVLDVSVDKI